MKKSLLAVMLTGLFALVSLPALGNVNLEQLKQKAESGEAKAQLELGYRYFQGNETTKDLTQAMGLVSPCRRAGIHPGRICTGVTLYER
ncbi:Uncharacterised protein [Escherichia coli]|nr:Uncharacterised protein [Escherichia coli]